MKRGVGAVVIQAERCRRPAGQLRGLNWGVLACIFATLAALGTADARVRWSTPGSYRLWVLEMTSFDLDATPTASGEQALGRHRLRLQPRVEVGPVSVYIELDVLTGQIFGTTSEIGSSFTLRSESDPDDAYDGWTTVQPRQAWFSVSYPWVDLKLGQFESHWGMGLMESDGEDRGNDSWLLRPGGKWGGDLVDRVEVSLRPLAPFNHQSLGAVVLQGGLGTVYQDDRVSLLDEDSAFEWHVGVRYPGEDYDFGVRYLSRSESRADGSSLDRSSVDTYLTGKVPLYLSNAEVRFGLQGILTSGTSSVGTLKRDEVGVATIGRAELRWHCPRVAVGLDLGYVSGDDPATPANEALTLDPDFRAGFILFSDVMRLISVRGADRVRVLGGNQSDRGPTGDIPTHGAIRNVQYLQPGVAWRPGPFALGLMGLFAWAPAPVYDPVLTPEATQPLNSFGDRAARFYGVELTGVLRYTLRLPRYRSASAGLDLGLFLPGDAVKAQNTQSSVTKIVWRLDLGW